MITEKINFVALHFIIFYCIFGTFLHLLSKVLKNSLIYTNVIPFQSRKTVFTIQNFNPSFAEGNFISVK